jgi:hypothetical protein
MKVGKKKLVYLAYLEASLHNLLGHVSSRIYKI